MILAASPSRLRLSGPVLSPRDAAAQTATAIEGWLAIYRIGGASLGCRACLPADAFGLTPLKMRFRRFGTRLQDSNVIAMLIIDAVGRPWSRLSNATPCLHLSSASKYRDGAPARRSDAPQRAPPCQFSIRCRRLDTQPLLKVLARLTSLPPSRPRLHYFAAEISRSVSPAAWHFKPRFRGLTCLRRSSLRK